MPQRIRKKREEPWAAAAEKFDENQPVRPGSSMVMNGI